jgi:hypothetical protein
MKAKKSRPKYPIFRLFWVTSRGESTYHTKRKGSFLYRLEALQDLQTLKKCWWMIQYRQGKYCRNESIEYTDAKEAFEVAQLFATAKEINQWL